MNILLLLLALSAHPGQAIVVDIPFEPELDAITLEWQSQKIQMAQNPGLLATAADYARSDLNTGLCGAAVPNAEQYSACVTRIPSPGCFLVCGIGFSVAQYLFSNN